MSNFSSRIAALLLTTFLVTIAALSFADAEAKVVTYDLNIPPEDLTSALQSFAIASHHKLLYKTELTSGKSSAGLRGRYTAEQAMEKLLSGSGLTFEITGSAVVLVREISNAGKTGDVVAPTERAQPLRQDDDRRPTMVAQAAPKANPQDESIPQQQSSSSPRGEEKDDLAEIIVTGTHIRNSSNPTAPLTVITREDIERSGFTTTQQLTASLPQNFGGGDVGASEDGAIGGGGASRGNQHLRHGDQPPGPRRIIYISVA